jgi:hypothetical protein
MGGCQARYSVRVTRPDVGDLPITGASADGLFVAARLRELSTPELGGFRCTALVTAPAGRTGFNKPDPAVAATLAGIEAGAGLGGYYSRGAS